MLSKILFVGLNYDQLPYLKVLLDRGFIVIGCDQNAAAPGVPLAHHYIQCSYDDHISIENYLKDNGIGDIDYIFSAAAQFAQKTCSYLANRLKIRYPSTDLVEIILDKAKFYPWFAENGLPIPTTSYVTNLNELKAILLDGNNSEEYFVKSDYSKNPNYIYTGTAKEILSLDLNWTKDKFLKDAYIVQKKLNGRSLRINIGPNCEYVFDFQTGSIISRKSIYLSSAIARLKDFLAANNLSSWIIKFDIIFDGKKFWVLDIGIDPPMRLKNYSLGRGENFYEWYVDVMLESQNA